MNKNRKIIYLVGFLFSIPIALTSYINSSFLSSFVDKKLVGIIYILGSIISIIALLLAPKIFRKIGGYKFLLLISFLDILSLLVFTFTRSAWSAIMTFIIYFSLNTLMVFSLDELLKIFSQDNATGRIRGIYLAICSFAWVLAQLASGTILGEFSFRGIYLISFCIMTLFLLISLFSLNEMPDPKYNKTKVIKYIKEYFKNKKLFHAYSLNLLLQFFYSWMVIYTPIYLSSYLGFSWSQIGIIFSLMLLPFVIIPFHLGKYADKIGERKILMLGFAITAFSTFSLFFIKGHSLLLWALLLFITRVGAVSVEAMSDVYFFKHIKPENDEFISIYRSASPVSYIIGPLFAFIALYFIPSFNFLYIILGTLMLLGIYLSSIIKKTDI